MLRAPMVTTDTWDELVTNAEGVVMVQFWSENCSICRAMEPVVEQIARDYEGSMDVYGMNAVAHAAMGRQERIGAVPASVWYYQGVEVAYLYGAHPRKEYMRKIEHAISQVTEIDIELPI